jgi:hypothetical protein
MPFIVLEMPLIIEEIIHTSSVGKDGRCSPFGNQEYEE